jgi:hypothetical protein
LVDDGLISDISGMYDQFARPQLFQHRFSQQAMRIRQDAKYPFPDGIHLMIIATFWVPCPPLKNISGTTLTVSPLFPLKKNAGKDCLVCSY